MSKAFRDLWVDTRPTAQPRRSYSGPEVSVFVSYARIDDKSSYGRVSKLIDDVADTYQSITGQRVGVFKDVESIQPGDDWRDRNKTRPLCFVHIPSIHFASVSSKRKLPRRAE